MSSAAPDDTDVGTICPEVRTYSRSEKMQNFVISFKVLYGSSGLRKVNTVIH